MRKFIVFSIVAVIIGWSFFLYVTDYFVHAQTSQITINAATNLGPSSAIKNFLAHQGTWIMASDLSTPESRFIQDAWRETIVSFSEFTFFYEDFNILVTRPSACTPQTPGCLNIDFTNFDLELNYQITQNRPEKISFSVGIMPRALSSRPLDPNYAYYPPANHGEWQDTVRRVVTHIKNKPEWRGRFNGASYMFWTEPDTHTYWQGTVEDFVSLYISTWRGVKAADPAAKLGAPMTVTASEPFMTSFITKLGQYNASQPPANRVTLDEVIWQYYNWDFDEKLSNGVDFIRNLLPQHGFPANTELQVNGWNIWLPGSDSHCINYSLQKRASFYASNIIRELNPGGVRRLSRAYLWPFVGDGSEDAFGSYPCRNSGIITVPDPADPGIGYSKRPAFAALQMLKAMTTGSFISVDSPPSMPDLFQVLATRDGTSKVSVLLANHTDISQTIDLTIQNLSFGTSTARRRIQRIDTAHSSDGRGLEAGTIDTINLSGRSVTMPLQLPAHSVYKVTLESSTR